MYSSILMAKLALYLPALLAAQVYAQPLDSTLTDLQTQNISSLVASSSNGSVETGRFVASLTSNDSINATVGNPPYWPWEHVVRREARVYRGFALYDVEGFRFTVYPGDVVYLSVRAQNSVTGTTTLGGLAPYELCYEAWDGSHRYTLDSICATYRLDARGNLYQDGWRKGLRTGVPTFGAITWPVAFVLGDVKAKLNAKNINGPISAARINDQTDPDLPGITFWSVDVITPTATSRESTWRVFADGTIYSVGANGEVQQNQTTTTTAPVAIGTGSVATS